MNPKTWTVYAMDGHIKSINVGTEPIPAELNGCLYVEGVSHWDTHYVLDGVITTRPSFDIVNPTPSIPIAGTFMLTGLPGGTSVTHPDGIDIVNDGEIEWDTVQSGKYKFLLENFPYKPMEITLEVEDA